jgi:hypothetical protein
LEEIVFRLNPHPEDFIPGDVKERHNGLDHREQEKTLQPRRGSTPVRFETDTGCCVVDFHDRLCDFQLIVKALRDTRADFGYDSVKKVVLLLCQEAMQEACVAVQLAQLGFDRVLEKYDPTEIRLFGDDPRAMFRWEKTLKQRKTSEEKA